jgi:3-oxoacyl-[acyl-carrier-protein] synthase II
MAEGAGTLILEEEQHAIKRGAKIYGVLAGAGMSSDGYHIAAPEPEGKGATRAMQFAMQDAGIKPENISHVNAHATSTPVGDIAEFKALSAALGKNLNNVIVTATKSMTGHLLGGAGAVESVFTLLALKNNLIPPTINLDSQDVQIKVNVATINNNSLPNNSTHALNNSFGFGGHNVSLVFAKN